MGLKVGQDAPLFSLPSTSGKDFKFENQKGKYSLLYFYPKDFTPGCTAEACAFNENLIEFNTINCDVFGISTDSIESHLKFKKFHKLNFELLSDTSGKVSKLYSALFPFVNTSKRISYLIGPDLKILEVYNSLFKAKNHITTMLKALTEAK